MTLLLGKRAALLATLLVVASVALCLVVPHAHGGEVASNSDHDCAICQFHKGVTPAAAPLVSLAPPESGSAHFLPGDLPVVLVFCAVAHPLRGPPLS